MARALPCAKTSRIREAYDRGRRTDEALAYGVKSTAGRLELVAANQEVNGQLLAKGSLASVIFCTEDCDETFERLRAASAEVMQEPADQPYGVRDCAFRNPSGDHIRCSGR